MDLGGSLLVKAAALAAVSASSLLGIPLRPGIHRKFVGPGRALRRDLRGLGYRVYQLVTSKWVTLWKVGCVI